MMTRLTLSSAPAAEPVSTAEAKTHMRVETSADDTYIATLVVAARRYCEAVQKRAFITQTWKLYLDRFPSVIRIPKPPLQSVSSIAYLDTNGDSQTLSSSIYTVDTDSEPGIVYEAYNQQWPSTRDVEKAITVTFIAGYGDASTDVPAEVKHAIKLLVAHWYEHREAVADGVTPADVPLTVKSLLGISRTFSFGGGA